MSVSSNSVGLIITTRSSNETKTNTDIIGNGTAKLIPTLWPNVDFF